MKNHENQELEVGPPPNLKLVWASSVAIIAILLTNTFLLHSQSAENRGTFGDMFGFSNALFSGFALLGLVYAILLQRHEVSIAKREIKHTKEILDEQQKQLHRQNLLSEKQNFEATFFNLLSLFAQLTERMDLEIAPKKAGMTNITIEDGKIFTGKDVFPIFSKLIWDSYGKKVIDDSSLHDCIKPYEDFYKSYNSELGHYFRTLYNIVKFVENSNIEHKRLYTNLVRAQLSDAEVEIIFHNGLSKHGIDKFKPLIEKYTFLKNLNSENIREKKLLKFYAESTHS